ncbi:hypothetical protein [Haloferula sp.]|uniref:hypothetical protein n=1 Tax=Haloferula sp. TaxID=2497595 RepID=UPI003C73CA67
MDERLNSGRQWERAACPYLPMVDRVLSYEWTRVHRANRGAAFYLATLEYAQSLWLVGKPAQAILQLNLAWAVDLQEEEGILVQWPLPYRALRWILEHRMEAGFLGNPVRHFQHLATRVGGERFELRSWRAWACFHVSSLVLPPSEFPQDLLQIEKEDLLIPAIDEVLKSLDRWGIADEASLFEGVMSEAIW